MGINGLVVFRILYPVLRWLGWSAVLLYFVAALGLLGLRYVVLPNIDQYKASIETHLSAALGSSVTLGSLEVQWHHLNPKFELTQVRLSGEQGQPLLTVPRVNAVLSWRSIFSLAPEFVSLHARGIDMSVRRDAQGQIWLFGRALDMGRVPGDDVPPGGGAAAQWLLSQPHIVLQDSTLRWTDESRGAVPLVLRNLHLNIHNHGQQHQFSLAASPPNEAAQRFDLRGNFRWSQDASRPVTHETAAGQLFVGVEDLRPDTWRAWIDIPAGVDADQVSVRVWLQVKDGAVHDMAAEIDVRGGQWQVTDTHGVGADQVRAFVRKQGNAFQAAPSATSGTQTDNDALVTFQLQGQRIALSLVEHYADPLMLEGLSASGTAGYGAEGLWIDAKNVAVANADAQAAGEVQWTYKAGQGPGHINASGTIGRADLTAVHRYMPRWVDEEVREWLEQGLLAGLVHDARLTLRGDLTQFPFETPGSDGEFRIQASYQDAIVDYLPPDDDAGWPRLDAMNGDLDLHGASLGIRADTARIHPKDESFVQLTGVNAHIDNLRDDPVLRVQGDTRGDASDYLSFMRNSPLGGMLNHVFDPAQAHGEWQVPLQLTIPLARASDTTVQGSIGMDGTLIEFDPELPAFSSTKGSVEFTEDVVTVHGLVANFLGQPVQLSGGVGPGQPGIRMTGKVGAEALAGLINAPGMQRFSGTTSYTATLTGVAQNDAGKALTLDITSDLNGLAMDFPPPLNKSPDQSWPLHAVWEHGKAAGTRQLEIDLGEDMHARFVHHGDPASPAYFQAGSIGVGRRAEWPEKGLNVDIEHPVFDGDAWDAITKEFVASGGGDKGRPLFPKVRTLRLQTGQGRLLGLDLRELTYTVKQTAADEWRADVSSTGTAGTLTWHESNDRIDGPVHAVFHRLSFGGVAPDAAEDQAKGSASEAGSADDKPQPKDADSEGPDVADDLHIPAINLIIENLELYGRQVGKLALVGVNEDRGRIWRLQQVALTSPSAHLEGTGVWRLRGPERGLTLDAHVDVSDLGDYFDQIGFEDMLSGGEGSIQGVIEWHDLPWSFDKNRIDGNVSFTFKKGRLSTVNSRSARLLELISLQSIRRLATLDFNPLNLTKDGFPYDVLRGSLRLDQGTVKTEDYRIIGPVGTIVLDGLVYLSTGKLDLQAVVVPNLDVSGAAIAAGIAINPVVGIGAFLTQWLLKAPLAEAMTAQYEIGGDWDDPEIKAVERIRSGTPKPVAH